MAVNSTLSVAALLTVACLLVAVPVQAGDYPEKEGRHSITHGQKGFRDVLLYSDEPTVTSKFMKVQSYDVCYPKEGQNDRVTINYYSVVAVNNEGLAYIHKERKSDQYRVCFHLKTLRGKGYHFKVEVWGTRY